MTDFGFTGGFDPTAEYSFLGWGLYPQVLLRTLVTFRHVAGSAGTEVLADLATDPGHVSDDGLTYTFRLKPGIRFGPPVSRPITSADVEYAFERIDTQQLVAQYPFYYDGVIVGMHPHPGPPAPISGIETPDPSTVVFHLTHPTGDFLQRLTLPATSPIPREVARCFSRAGDYGRDVVSSGPYMIEGADQIDISSCATIRPMAGFDPLHRLMLVRNPDYDPATDNPEVRENLIDGVDVRIDPVASDIYQKIRVGILNGSLMGPPPRAIVRRYLRDPSLAHLVHVGSFDRTYYITMNLLVPPFDDIHVRKAVNWVMDKAALQRVWGGQAFGEIGTHPDPPNLLGGLGQSYDPYPSPGYRGNLEMAKAEMKQSKYDHNGDGVCDDPACVNVTFVNRNSLPQVATTPIIVDRLSGIGIQLHPKLYDTGTGYTLIQTVRNLIPISAVPAWTKDYFDPWTFARRVFHSEGIQCEGQLNYAEVGMTRDQASRCGVLPEWRAARPPSVDAALDSCVPKTRDRRGRCWRLVESQVMENVVPWVPFIWSSDPIIVNDSVSRFVYDQFGGMISLCHIALG